MTAYRLNGTTASIVPYKQTWEDLTYGTDHLGAPIVSAFKNCTLEFDSMNYASAQQWLQFCNTGTSLATLTILNLDGTSFTAFSGVFLSMQSRPTFESGYVGPFSIKVVKLIP